MTVSLIVCFDPKILTPLEIINEINNLLTDMLVDHKINDYSISIPVDLPDIDVIVLVAEESEKNET